MRLPHLIHVGLPKTGSTFLQHWFERHPQIAYAKGGFAGYGDIWKLPRLAAAPDPAWRCRVTSAEQLSYPVDQPTEETLGPGSLRAAIEGQERVCDTLLELFPDAHLLVVTRGFAGVFHSSYSQYLREGGNLPAEELLPKLAHAAHYVGLYDYDRIAAMYRSRFGERVLVLPYEWLRDDRAAFLAAIAAPLGLDPFDPGPEPINASLSLAQMRWYPRFARRFARIPVGPLRRRLLAQHRWRAQRGGWGKLIRLLERAGPSSPPLPDFAPKTLDHLAPLAAQLRTEPAFRPYQRDYLG